MPGEKRGIQRERERESESESVCVCVCAWVLGRLRFARRPHLYVCMRRVECALSSAVDQSPGWRPSSVCVCVCRAGRWPMACAGDWLLVRVCSAAALLLVVGVVGWVGFLRSLLSN